MNCNALVGKSYDRRYGARPCPHPARYEYPWPSSVTWGTFQKQTCGLHTPKEYRNPKFGIEKGQ